MSLALFYGGVILLAIVTDNMSFLIYPWYILATIITITLNISLAVKRFHDVGHQGSEVLLLIIPFVNIYYLFWLTFKQGEQSENIHGPSPKLLQLSAFIGK